MNGTAFTELYHTSYPRLSAQISWYLGDAAEAEDVVQEAYLRTWQRWDRIVTYDDPFLFLRRVAWNLATSRWRRLTTAARFMRRQPPAEHASELQPDHVAVVAALKQLPEQQRRALVLHHIADLPVDTIAAELGVPKGTVLSWLHRGREKMADLLTDDLAPARPVPPIATVHRRAKRQRRVKAVLAVLGLAGTAAAVAGFMARPPQAQPPVTVITAVNWRDTVIDLPGDGRPCPAGRQRVKPDGVKAGLIAGPRDLSTDPLYLDPSRVRYGDVTGDGQPEALIPVWCSPAGSYLIQEENPAEARLLVVQMQDDQQLRGLAYVGPAGAMFHSYEAEEGELRVVVQYETATTWSVYAPAHTRTYHWNGATFTQTSGRTEPLILVPVKTGRGSDVDLAEIRDGGTVACPARRIQFSGESTTFVYAAWADLDRDGNSEGIVQIGCNGTDSLFLLGQGQTSFTTLAIPYASNGTESIEPDGWELAGTTLTIRLRHNGTGITRTLTLNWNGTTFA